MAIPLEITIGDPDAVIAAWDRILIERGTAQAGPFAEITTPATRLVLEPAKVVYKYEDSEGTEESWYRTAYYSAKRGERSSVASPPFMGAIDQALELLPIALLKERYLHGVSTRDENGRPLPDTAFEHYVRAAFARLTSDLQIPILETRVVDEKHDFFQTDWDQRWGKIKLHKFPLIQVEKVALNITGTSESEIPLEWISVRGGLSRTINVRPMSGSMQLILRDSGPAWWLAMRRETWIPNAFSVTYRCGFPRGRVPPNLIDLAGKIASFGPLNIAGDLIGGPGIASFSLSMDGLSKSVSTTSSATNAGYGSRLLQYTSELKAELPKLRDYYHGGDLEAG